MTKQNNFQYFIEQFADVKILRFQVPEFEHLSLQQKTLIYYLSQAALEGRDILFDQNNSHNLAIRRTLEAIYIEGKEDADSDDYKAFEIYLKRVWFSNGIHHHYSMDKFKPGFARDFFVDAIRKLNPVDLPKDKDESTDDFINRIAEIIFNEKLYAKRVNQADGVDVIKSSANNYYAESISQDEVERFYADKSSPDPNRAVSFGLNSKLEKTNGHVHEVVWKKDGMYGKAIDKIIGWLKRAIAVTENEEQKKAIQLLVEFYQSGSLETFDEYSIAWLNDKHSRIDFVNGFIETYGDALGLKASWESLVNFKDLEASKRTELISENAQWFEDQSPVDATYKKKVVKGVSAKVITAAMLGGDCYPATPIGVNLPNSDWIRKEYGSKSVSVENISYAHHKAAEGNGFLEEFALSQPEVKRYKTYGFACDNLHTDLHECLGHGSGQLAPGVKGDELKTYGATIEEARADLFGLYYLGDEKLVELGLLPDTDAYKAAYDGFIRNGLMTQLTRISLGSDVIESHMRNRQLIAAWCYEKGQSQKIIEKCVKEGKTYFVVRDYEKLRLLFGNLLKEIQRIKSEGDFVAARNLVENYAVKVDQDLHKEVLERFKKLNIAPYSGFLNPEYKPLYEDGEIVDVVIHYADSYASQMLEYARKHSWLPNKN